MMVVTLLHLDGWSIGGHNLNIWDFPKNRVVIFSMISPKNWYYLIQVLSQKQCINLLTLRQALNFRSNVLQLELTTLDYYLAKK